MSSVAAHDAVIYPSQPIFTCQPRRMAAVAAWCGVKPPDVAQATVVDLGCADAGNLIAIAAAYPGVTAIGVDPAATALQQGADVARDAGLANVSLVQDTIAPIDDGTADFVIVHGVLSWVDDDARAAVIAEAARITRPGGLVMLSYNASPGSLLRAVTRSIGRRAAKRAIDAGDAESARSAVLNQLAAAAQSAPPESDFAAVAADQAQRVAERPAAFLFHDELTEHWTPLAVSDLAAQTGRAGLSYVGELQPGDRWRERFPVQQTRSIVQLAGPSRAAQQQLVDDVLGAEFHTSLFVRGAAPREPIGGGPRRPVGPAAAQWHVSTDFHGEWPEFPADLAAVAAVVRTAGAVGLLVGEIAARTGQSADSIRQAAAVLDAQGFADLHLGPAPAAATADDRPRASTLAQAQVRQGLEMVTSLRHRDVTLDDARIRELFLLLDGTRDRGQLATEIAAWSIDGADQLVAVIDDVLQQFAAAGLLSP